MKFDSLYCNKKTLRTTIIALLLVSAFLIPAIAEINTRGTYFWISPERNIYADPSENIEIAINIANAPETFAWGLKLEYNASVLSLVSVSKGTWLSSINQTFFDYKVNGGNVAIEESFVVDVAMGASNGGWLCNVTFHVDTAGRSKLNLYDTYLLDMDLESTDYPNNDGFFCANDAFPGLHDVYVVDIRVDEEQVQQGAYVNITVEIHNEGNQTQTVDVDVYADADDERVARVDIYTFSSVSIDVCEHINLSVLWNTVLVPGELWTITAEVIKPDDDDLHDNILLGPEVLVTSTHDIKIVDKEILTPFAKKKVMINFTGEGGAPVFSIAPCNNYSIEFTDPQGNSYDGTTGMLPPPGTWWHIVVAGSLEPYEMNSVEFHVDSINKADQTFHIDKVILPDGTEGSFVPVNPALWVMAERTAKIAVTVKNEGKVEEDVDVYVFYEDPDAEIQFFPLAPDPFEPCTWYSFVSLGGIPEICTWWHIIEAPAAPWLVSKEFHIDMVDLDTFHIDFVWPDWGEPIEGPITAVQEKVIGMQTVSLAPLESKTIYYHWLGFYSDVPCGEYTITAFAYPVLGEEEKNWDDNKYVDGTIEVRFADLAVASIELLTDCYPGGLYPLVVPRTTIVNLGCEAVSAVCYFLADPNLVVDGDEIIFGIAITGPIKPGEVRTFVGASPFGGWLSVQWMPSIAPPVNYPSPGTNYTIIVQAVPGPGYQDNDMSNNVNMESYGPPYGPGWQLPVVTHDVHVTAIDIIDCTRCKDPTAARPEYYPGNDICVYNVSVTVCNDGIYLYPENVTVTLKYEGVTVGTKTFNIPGTNPALLPAWGYYKTVYFEEVCISIESSPDLTPCGVRGIADYLTAEVAIVSAGLPEDDDPCDNSRTQFTGGSFYLRIMGDSNGDGAVDGGDMKKIQNAMFSWTPAPICNASMGDLTPPDSQYMQGTPAEWAWNFISATAPNWCYQYWNEYPIYTDMDGSCFIDGGDGKKCQNNMFASCP